MQYGILSAWSKRYLSNHLCGPQIRMPKIIALPQHRLALLPRQCVGEAVAEVQPGRVAVALAKVAVCLAGNLRLRRRDRFDDDLESLLELS